MIPLDRGLPVCVTWLTIANDALVSSRQTRSVVGPAGDPVSLTVSR
jgi:hypothetical protein